MDADDDAQAACLADSLRQLQAGNATGAQANLQRYLEHPRPQHLLRALEMIITISMQLWDYKSALSYAERFVQASPPESAHLVSAYHLMAACLRHMGSHVAAVSYCDRALELGDSLGLQGSAVYGRVFSELASTHKDMAWKVGAANITMACDHFNRALDTIIRAEGQGHSMPALLSTKADCLMGLGKVPDAIPVLAQVVHANASTGDAMINVLNCATANLSFARGLYDIAQYGEAALYGRECLALRTRFYPPNHPILEQTRSFVRDAEHHATSYIDSQEQADEGFRQCNHCHKISMGMRVCRGCLVAWYCDSDCKKKDLVLHEPSCRRCWSCGAVGAKQKCSGCRIVRYCNVQCAKAFWPRHKADCPAGNKK